MLQLSPENWMVFMQHNGIGKRLEVLETEAGREAQLFREGRTAGLGPVTGAPLGDRLCLLSAQRLFSL